MFIEGEKIGCKPTVTWTVPQHEWYFGWFRRNGSILPEQQTYRLNLIKFRGTHHSKGTARFMAFVADKNEVAILDIVKRIN